MRSGVRTTLKSLSGELGVSPATVSLVLGGRGPELGISTSTQRRIRETAKRLSYSPHAGARMLKRQRSHTIAIVTRRARYGLANAVLTKMIDTAERIISDHDYNMFINQVDVAYDVKHDHEFDILDLPKPIRESAVDGLVFISIAPGKFESHIKRCLGKRPCVQVQGTPAIDAPNFTYEPIDAGKLVAKYLYELGHHNVACLRGPHYVEYAHQTVEGFVSEWKKRTATLPEVVYEGDFEVEAGRSLGLKFLQRTKKGDVTAVFCGNDMMAFGVMQAAHELGWHVPDEIAVIGMDNVTASQWSAPPLTTLDIPHEWMMRQALEYLIARIEGKDDLPAIEPTHASIVERASVLPRQKMNV